MPVIVGSVCEKGVGRAQNQDGLTVKIMADGGGVCLAAVCDGVGALPDSQVACAVILTRLREWFDAETHALADMERLKQSLIKRLFDIHQELLTLSQEQGYRMGATLSMMLTVNQRYFISHIGDSRIYAVYRKLIRLTDDHLYNGKKLTQALGCPPGIEPFYAEGHLDAPHGYLLCTDGLYKTLKEWPSIRRIKKIKTNEDAEQCAQWLLKQAQARKEQDDITAILLQFK